MATQSEINARTQELIKSGLSPETAQKQAIKELGQPTVEADDAPKSEEKKTNPVVEGLKNTGEAIGNVFHNIGNAANNLKSKATQAATGETKVSSHGQPADVAKRNREQAKKQSGWQTRKTLIRLIDNAQDEDDFVRSVLNSDNLGKGRVPMDEDSLRKQYQARKGDIIKLNHKTKTDGDPNGSASSGGTSKVNAGTGTGTGAVGGTETGTGTKMDDTNKGEGGEDEEKGWKPSKSYVGDKRAYSIWDAYKKGMLDKGGATYYTIDSIANFLKNTGRGIGNVGAQFTGGTIDNNVDQSEWNKAQQAMNKEERQKWIEGQGSKAERQADSELIANDISKINKGILQNRKDYMDYWKKKADEAALEGNERQAVLYMAMAYGAPTDPYSVLQGQGIAGLMGGLEKGWASAQEWWNNRNK